MRVVKLLVCVDLSPLAEPVLDEAITLAKPLSAQVVLLHVAEPERMLTSGGAAAPQVHRTPPVDIEKRRALLDAASARLTGEGLVVDTQLAITTESTAETILEHASTAGARYVVLGSHGHGRTFELLVGSTTQGVLRGAKVPVVVVPSAREPRRG